MRRDSTGNLAHVVGVDAVVTCVDVLLSTGLNELPQDPSLGNRLSRMRHEPNDAALLREMREECTEALARREPRVRVLGVTEEVQQGHETRLRVALMVRGTRDQRPVWPTVG